MTAPKDSQPGTPLLPCPFCGSQSITISYFNQPATKLAASCQACIAVGPVVDRYADPFVQWNTRATPQGASTREAVRAERLRLELEKIAWMDEFLDADGARAMMQIARDAVNEDERCSTDTTDHIDWDIMAEERLGQRPRSEHGRHIPQTSPAPGCDSGSPSTPRYPEGDPRNDTL